jgi:hypothetical protein
MAAAGLQLHLEAIQSVAVDEEEHSGRKYLGEEDEH